MAIDTRQIDEAIRLEQEEHERRMERLAVVKSIASDPEALEILRKLMSQNGTANGVSPAAPTPSQYTLAPSTHPEASTDERGAQIAAIRKMIAAQTGQFTVSSLGDALRAQGMDIDNIAVGRALQRLWRKYKEIDLVTEGGGGNVPNAYIKTDRLKVPR